MRNPRLLKIYCTNHVRTGYGKEDIETEQFLESSLLYNADGKVLKEEHYLSDKEPDTLVNNEYDENGRLIATFQYDGNKILIQKSEFYYDEQGDMTRQDNYFGEGSSVYTTGFIYTDGLLARQDSYDCGQFAYIEKEYFYNDDRLLTKQIEYDEDGNKKYIITNEYNADKLVVKRVREEIMEKDRRIYLFEYDRKGNKIKDLIYDYQEILIAKTYYTFDELNRLIEKEDEDLDHYMKTNYSYDGENVIKMEMLDKDRNLLSWTEYSYDEDNQIISIRQYNADEADDNNLRLVSEYRYERYYE